MSFDHPTYNYLGHFKKAKFLKQGHNDSGSLKHVGLDQSEVERFQAGFNGNLGLSPKTGGGQEASPAPKTEVIDHKDAPYNAKKTRITLK